MISVGGIKIPYGSTTYELKLIFNTLNFIGIWLKSFETVYVWRCNVYREKSSDFFNNIPLKMHERKTGYFKKRQNLLTYIGGGGGRV